MKGYSSVNEEILWLHLKSEVADLENFIHSVDIMIILLNPTYG